MLYFSYYATIINPHHLEVAAIRISVGKENNALLLNFEIIWQIQYPGRWAQTRHIANTDELQSRRSN